MAKTIFYSPAALVRKILFCHSKIKFISSRHRVISSIYVSVGNVSNMSYKREEVQVKNKIRLVKYLNTGRDKSKTTLDLRGDFHLYLFSFFLSSLSFFFENQIPFPSNVSFLTWLWPLCALFVASCLKIERKDISACTVNYEEYTFFLYF